MQKEGEKIVLSTEEKKGKWGKEGITPPPCLSKFRQLCPVQSRWKNARISARMSGFKSRDSESFIVLPYFSKSCGRPFSGNPRHDSNGNACSRS
jgi:hypothetical protein